MSLGYSAVCAMVRDEPDLREWVAYHLAIGFEHVYLYDNESKMPVSVVLRDFVAAGKVSTYLVRGKKQQVITVFPDVLRRAESQFRWVAFIDADEFILPHDTDDINVFLSDYEKHPGLGINWQIFGDNGYLKRPSGLIIENYLRRGRDGFPENNQIKCIVSPKEALWAQNPHSFNMRTNNGLVDPNGNPIPVNSKYCQAFNYPPVVARIQINHYYIRSAEDFERKVKQGGGAGIQRNERDFENIKRCCNEVRDERILRFAARTRELMGEMDEKQVVRLRSIPSEKSFLFARDIGDRVRFINLNRHPARRSRMEGIFASLGISATRVPAVDGKLLPPIDGKNMAEVALTIGQKGLWQEVVATGKPFALFEDDVIFCKRFREYWHEREITIPEDTDIFYLGLLWPHVVPHKEHSHLHSVQHCFGTASYILFPSGARKLIEAEEREPNRACDHYPHSLLKAGKLIGVCPKPTWCIQQWAESSIAPRCSDAHLRFGDVFEDDLLETGGGNPSWLLSAGHSDPKGSVLGFDIGGTLIKWAIMSSAGETLLSGSVPSDGKLDNLLPLHLVELAKPHIGRFQSVAIGICGAVENGSYSGYLRSAGLAPNFSEEIASALGVPVFLEWDATCWGAGLALTFDNEFRGKRALALSFGTGVAAAVIDEQGEFAPLAVGELPTNVMSELLAACCYTGKVLAGIHQVFGAVMVRQMEADGLPPKAIGELLAARWALLIQKLIGHEDPAGWVVLIGGGLVYHVDEVALRARVPCPVHITKDVAVPLRGAMHVFGLLKLPETRVEKPVTSLSVVTLWRGTWSAVNEVLLDWMQKEIFPEGTQFVWVAPEGSEAERKLEAEWGVFESQERGYTCSLTGTGAVPAFGSRVEKHQIVAALYNEALSSVGDSDTVIFIEDDVIPEHGASAALLAALQRRPQAGAIMAAYPRRSNQNEVCAMGLDRRYIPWPKDDDCRLLEVDWMGGGFVVYRGDALRQAGALFATGQGALLTAGWDVNLCRALRKNGFRSFVDLGNRAEHRCL